MHKRRLWLAAVVSVVASAPLFTSWSPLSPFSTPPSAVYSGNHAFFHGTGLPTLAGWDAYYHVHAPGYLAAGLKTGGDRLPEGNYRYDFYFTPRSGHLASLLSDANDVVRLEAHDVTGREVLEERTLQSADFKAGSDRILRKSLTFSTFGRGGHRVEPRVYWQGLSGINLVRVERSVLPSAPATALRQKAIDFERLMRDVYLERGYVVVRNEKGQAADLGDAAIWTGLYAAAEALRYQSTRDPAALANLERSLWALHGLCKAAPLPGTVARYVEPSGAALPQAASKDTYTGFFYGVARGLPYVKDPALHKALTADVERVAGHFLDHDLRFISPYGVSVDMNPYLDSGFVTEAVQSLREDTHLRHDLIKTFRLIRWYFWLHGQEAPDAFGHMVKALAHPSSARYEDELLPLANDMRVALKAFQRNVHRASLRGPRQGLTDTPYIKLDLILLRALNNMDAMTAGKPFASLQDLKILPSQSLHALHFIKVAAEVLPKPNRFDTYYHANLFEGKALLGTAVAWHQMDEDAMSAVMGQSQSDTRRNASNHLSFLALQDLILLEKDPILRFKYQKLFEEQARPMRQDGNAMVEAMEAQIGIGTKQLGLAWEALALYPTDRRGLGEEYWKDNREILVDAFGGEVNGQAREVVPADLRPRDAFMWQRSAHSIIGDQKDWLYPPLDYLFAYWLASNAANFDAVTEKS